MSLTFTDFKLNLGLKDTERDTEYAAILQGLIKELFTTYGIALNKDVKETSQTINGNFDVVIELDYKNIINLTIDGKSEDIDYTLDKDKGEIVILSTGSMLEGINYSVVYDYYVFINESNTYNHIIYPTASEVLYHIDVKPYILKSVTYDDIELSKDIDYYEYNNTLELASTPTSVRTPYILNLELGYDYVPTDLKQAFYDLAQIRFDMKDKKTYLLNSVTDNSQGVSTNYKRDGIPKHIKNTFENYMGRNYCI